MALFFSLLTSAFFIGIDQVTKYLAVVYLKGQESVPIWPDVFELSYRPNTGVAFSMMEGYRWLFIPVTALVMGLLIVVLARSRMSRHLLFRSSCVLIIAGGIGNLIDRIHLGYVIDFLYFKLIDFPIFNFADCCVVVGAVLLVIYMLFILKEEEGETFGSLLFGARKCRKGNNDG